MWLPVHCFILLQLNNILGWGFVIHSSPGGCLDGFHFLAMNRAAMDSHVQVLGPPSHTTALPVQSPPTLHTLPLWNTSVSRQRVLGVWLLFSL
jgi:hypothetical protein